MTPEYKHLIPEDFHPSSKVWIYQSSRLFTISEALEIEQILEDFVTSWQSHGAPVKGYANLLFGQFIVLMADETTTTIGGCSTDTSIHMIKEIEQLCKVNMFDRQTLAFVVKDKIQLLPLSQINYGMENGFLNADSLYFNNLVSTKDELLNKWMIPIKESWLASRITVTQPVL
jgi:hypothetical protein